MNLSLCPISVSHRETAGQSTKTPGGTRNAVPTAQIRRSEHVSHCPYYVGARRGTPGRRLLRGPAHNTPPR